MDNDILWLHGHACEMCDRLFEFDCDDEYAFRFGHGHPVVCWRCWDDLPKAERDRHQRATAQTHED